METRTNEFYTTAKDIETSKIVLGKIKLCKVLYDLHNVMGSITSIPFQYVFH